VWRELLPVGTLSEEVSCGSVPVKSRTASSPVMRRATTSRHGLPSTLSSSAKSAKRYSPSGMLRRISRAWCSA